ncbi:MAG: glycosyl hydrolase 115 family protein, partial [Desulfobacteraceae bacterium]
MKKILVIFLMCLFTMMTAWQAFSADSINELVKEDTVGCGHHLSGGDSDDYVVFNPQNESFPLVVGNQAAPLVVSGDDYPGVIRAVDDLQLDISKVTDMEPTVSVDTIPEAEEIVIIGTIGKSPLIDKLIQNQRLNVDDIKGKWETFILETVKDPFPNVGSALVITGSDQRGTIFGIYDLSEQIGVSPWHFWDDVPPIQRNNLYVLQGRHTKGEPAVKYRGLFINDENPALGTWGPEYFGPGHHPDYEGGFNKELFSKVFEVILRLKANYL